MKKHSFIILYSFLCLISGILFSSLDIEPNYYGNYIPVYMKRADMEKAIKVESPRNMSNPGKIYVYGNYILINEKYKGIHVIDNSTPALPVPKAFLHIDGCIDMAMKNGILYADNAIDLIAVKPNSDFTTIEVTGRINEIFPEVQSPDGAWQNYQINEFRPKDGILVAWKIKE